MRSPPVLQHRTIAVNIQFNNSLLRRIINIHRGRILLDGQINNDLRDTACADDDGASELWLHTKICN